MTEVKDLPEPKKRTITNPAERIERQWNVLMALLTLVIGYSFIHKIVVPLSLKFTRLSASPYAEVDLWFALPVGLGIALKEKHFWIASFFAGGGIFYGLLESVLCLKGNYPGWLGFSKFLSAAPFAGVSIAMMSGNYPQRVPKAAWYGVCVVALLRMVIQIWSVW